MGDETHTTPGQPAPSPSLHSRGGLGYAAVSNTAAGNIYMIDCNTTSFITYTAAPQAAAPFAYANAEITSNSTPGDQVSALRLFSYGGIFPGSPNFGVAGGASARIMTNSSTTPAALSAFRMVPLADIDLQHEIHLNDATGVVGRQRGQPYVRRIYSARVRGRNTTVALYEGSGAEEEWRKDVEHYMSLRQMSGVASSGRIHATLFHDDLVPFQHFVDLHQYSLFLTLYLYVYCSMEFVQAARDYLSSPSGLQPLLVKSQTDCTVWIRRSTGSLCVDLMRPGNTFDFSDYELSAWPPSMPRLSPSTTLASVMDTLAVEQYHGICRLYSTLWRPILISTSMEVHLGVVIYLPSGTQFEDSVEIAFLRNADENLPQWESYGGRLGQVTEEGWTRFSSADVCNSILTLRRIRMGQPWLSQASYIFNCLKVTSNFEDYALLDIIQFQIIISANTGTPPAGFLFLCPQDDFQTRPSSYCWPEYPAYWSLDPSGDERLITEDAIRLGFPSLQLRTVVWLRSWDTAIYAGLRLVHQAKGFDPDSQEIAEHIGYPLYQFSNETEPLFAHGKSTFLPSSLVCG
ncbi:hypothetical protein MVEN_01449000 [Mycena venus]|uniref:Uncharacterized protein n=1 Tax=Mycena venus TaxID=2733690 RepID=A0A8H7CTL0_9AGAR|nr:hypothetical protein MVEN_01449000 [Mycena venus]